MNDCLEVYKAAIVYLSSYNGYGFQISFVLDDMLTASIGTVGPGHFVFTTLSQLQTALLW